MELIFSLFIVLFFPFVFLAVVYLMYSIARDVVLISTDKDNKLEEKFNPLVIIFSQNSLSPTSEIRRESLIKNVKRFILLWIFMFLIGLIEHLIIDT